MLPKTPATYLTERAGIVAVATAINSLGLIWRETSSGDVGVDGQIEYVDAQGQATGRLLSVQVKSGPSYLKNETADAFHFYPADKHRHYWEQHPLPVILVLHDPRTSRSFWADVRQQLRSETTQTALVVAKCNTLQTASAEQLFETVGLDGSAFIEGLSDIVDHMVRCRSNNASFRSPISIYSCTA